MSTFRLEGEVRLCRESDLPLLEWEPELRDHRAIFLEAFRRHQRGDNIMLVADIAGRIVGQAWIDLARHADEQVGFLWAVRVAPPLQGLKIGTLLLDCAERILVERGWSGAAIGVEKQNIAAKRLYERLGYRAVGDLSETWGYQTPSGRFVEHEMDEWILRKALSA